jgi:pimeloyl-ACP methyl ester carboxylesterase
MFPAVGVTTLPMPHVDGVEHRYATVDGVRLHYAEAGEGEPLVLLHGWPQHWWAWRELLGPLSQRYRVIAPDIRGIGWSDAPRDDYRFTRFADDLFGLLDALGIERTRLVGHDWGTGAGYMACLARPGRIERFVASGAPHIWSADGAPARLYARPWHLYVNASPLGELATKRLGVPGRCLREWRHSGSFTPEEVEIYTSPLRRPGSARATRLRYRTFLVGELATFVRRRGEMRLRTPTLHLNGADDPLTIGTPGSWRRYADDMRYETVADCGHFLAEEQPQEVLDRITEFLGG